MCNGNCKECGEQHELMPKTTRRTFMGLIVGIINVVLVGGLLAPVMAFVASPLRNKTKGQWHPILDENDLPVGATREATFTVKIRDGYRMAEQKYSVFLRRYPDKVACFDPACTHLGCRIHHEPKKGRFLCPCHGGVFDGDGNVVSGPPPKALDQYPAKIEDGKVWVYKEV